MKTLLTNLGLIIALAVGVGVVGSTTTTTTTAHADQRSTTARAASTTSHGDTIEAFTARLTRRGENLAVRVATRLDAARRERDRLRATCLDDTLSEVHAAMRVVKHESLRPMTPARARVLGRVWTERLVALDQQAMACERNEDLGASGVTRVITTVDPSAPNIDPTVLPRLPARDFYGDRR